MDLFNWKTRGTTPPTGKRKVYFCCHEDDFETYFEKISQQILNSQDCAIYYALPGVPRDEEFQSCMNEFDLVVVAVTAKFLFTKNDALDHDFLLAKALNKSILPLMQEPGLSATFNEKCGQLQYLDQSRQDTTAIAFEQKLERYLATVLISKELEDRIKAAFDAYIFLSYRKKDRSQAQELMRLIHENDFCRDVAIWYDEFLTPGENFNESIANILKKSDLFCLTVTPNLVDEKNYIMTTEYPMAKKERKRIVSAQMQPTNHWKLLRKYRWIPKCFDARDRDALAQILAKNLDRVAKAEHNNTPEHLLFIGLAYLNGIDVEKDPHRGISLITQAANAHVPEAIDQLINIYSYGLGVPADFGIASQWLSFRLNSFNFPNDTAETSLAQLDWCQRRGDLAKLLGAQEYLKLCSVQTGIAERPGLSLDRNRKIGILLQDAQARADYIGAKLGPIITNPVTLQIHYDLGVQILEKLLNSFRAYHEIVNGTAGLTYTEGDVELCLFQLKMAYAVRTSGDGILREAFTHLMQGRQEKDRLRGADPRWQIERHFLTQAYYEAAQSIDRQRTSPILSPISMEDFLRDLGKTYSGAFDLFEKDPGDSLEGETSRLEELCSNAALLPDDTLEDRRLKLKVYLHCANKWKAAKLYEKAAELFRKAEAVSISICDWTRTDQENFVLAKIRAQLAVCLDQLEQAEPMQEKLLESFRALHQLRDSYGTYASHYLLLHSQVCTYLAALYRQQKDQNQVIYYENLVREDDEMRLSQLKKFSE